MNNLFVLYEYPSIYTIKKIHKLMDEGITNKWEIEAIINNPKNRHPIIIDFIEMAMEEHL